MASSTETLNVSALKVAELKDELSKRGLPTNGLKKDLAERLQNAMDKIEKVEEKGADEIEGKVDVDFAEAQPAAAVMETVKIKEVEKKEEEEAPINAELAGKEADIGDVKFGKEAMTEEVVQEQSDATPMMEEQNEIVIGTEPAPELDQNGTAAEGLEKPSEEEVRVTTEEIIMQPDVAESLVDRMGKKLAQEDIEVVELGGDPDVEVEIQKEEYIIDDGAKEARGQDTPMVEEKKELTTHHPHGISPYSDPPTMLDSGEALEAKALPELDDDIRKLEDSCRSVYISGLIRPLTMPAFKAKVEEYGPLEDDMSSVWLDGVKTHAYVTYEQAESASRAVEGMSGIVYPPDTGREIQARNIPHDIVRRCIAIEELAWQEGRGKMDLRARKAGNSLIYSLHRLENNPVSNTSEPRAPKVTSLDDRVAPQSGRPHDRHVNQPRLDWGNSSSSNSYDRRRRDDYSRRDYLGNGGVRDNFNGYRGNRDDFRHHDRRDTNRGSSKADERVREVEARIMAERARGERPVVQRDDIKSPPYNNGRSYSSFTADKNRWSSREIEPSRRETDYSRSSYSDRRREYSPPPPRRDYSERGSRDEFGRDRHGRD